MIKHLRTIFLLTMVSAFGAKSYAQAISAIYPFTSVSTSSGTTDPTAVPTSTGVTFGSFSATGTPANPNASGRFSFQAWPTGATDGSNVFTGSVGTGEYYSVTITPQSGYAITLSSIAFTMQRSGTGIRQYVVRGSKDNYAANLPASITPANANLSVTGANIFQIADASTSAVAGSTVTLDANYANVTGPVTFRFYGFNAEAATGTFSINSVKFTGTASVNDVTPPTNTANYPAVANVTQTTADVSTNINEAGTTYYIILPATGTAPTTSAQVKAGTDGNNAVALKSGSIAAAANNTASVTVNGLSASTSYKAYVVSQDAAATPNLQTTFSALGFTTTSAGSPMADQHITFAATASTVYSATDYSPGATSDNTGIAITYTSSDASVATIVSNKVHMLKAGSITLTANQSGDGTHNAANPKQQTLTITAKPLTITGVTANDKIYNGDNTTTLSGTAALTGIVNADNVTLSGTPVATFPDATIGNNKPVTVTGYTLSGTAASNYTVIQPAGLTASINTAVVSPIIISQYYEGTSVNKWIELTNLSASPVNTTSPQLKLALYNIAGDAGNINITGTPSQSVNLNVTIPAYGSVLIANTGNGAEVPYITVAGAAQSDNSVINFNGNDGVALTDASNNILDAFGQGINAKDVSYIRNQSVTGPSTTYNPTEWTLVPIVDVQNAADLDDPRRLGVDLAPNFPPCVAPAAQGTSLVLSNVTASSISGNFTATSADEYVVVRSLSSTLSAGPVNGTIYNSGSTLGGGTVVGRIVSPTFTDNTLTSGTHYYYFVFALNNTACTGGPIYNGAAPLTGDATTTSLPACSTPTAQATNFHVTSFNSGTIQGAFTAAANADQYLVVMSTNSAITVSPVDGTTYNVGDAFGGGTVIKRGAGTTFSRSGLTQNTNYYFFTFSVNSLCTGGPLYLKTNPLTGIQKTAVFNASALNYYFGNLHGHSSFSDGNKEDLTKTPVDDYAFAKNSMNMDFLGISEHNHTQAGMHLASWQPGIDAAKAATTEKFVAMHGMEWGVISGGGHVVVYGIDSLIGWEAGEYQIFVPKSTYTGTTGLFKIINRHGLNAIATLAHPNTTDYNNLSATYDLSADSAIVGSALESGPAFSTNVTYSDPATSMAYLSYYNKMLAQGYHLGATMDHDNHYLTFGRHTRARLVVLAPALTENDLLEAMKKMRFYASEDSAAKINYMINGQPLGTVFTAQSFPAITVTSVTTSPVTSIKLMAGVPGSGITPTVLATSTSGTLTFSDNTLANLATDYYYLDVTENDGSRIITSPIWYTRDDSFKAPQQITIASTANATYGDADLDPAATSNNNTIPITYTTSDPTVATVIANKIHLLKAGTVTISANQAGNGSYTAATPQQELITIAPKAITIMADAKTKTYGDADPLLSYQVTAGSLVGTDTFTGSLNRAVGENVDTYTITQGSLMANSNYAVNYKSSNLVITVKPVTVTATAKSKVYGSADPVLTYSVTSGSLSNGDSFNGALTRDAGEATATYAITQGTLSLSANYALSFVTAAFTITNATRIITFNTLTVKTYGDADFTAGAAISSNETLAITSSNPNVVTVTGGLLHIVNAGTATITATAPVNANYGAITPVSQFLIVNKANQFINFPTIPEQQKGSSYSLSSVTSSVGIPLTFTSNDATVATITGLTLNAIGLGITNIVASAPGSVNYYPANSVVQPVRVTDNSSADNIIVHQGFSPNGDGINDYFIIEGIKDHPNNTVTIVNRNGVKVFEINGYDNQTKRFDGHSNITGALLQEGTYFYVLAYTDNGVGKRKTGYLVFKY